MGSAACIGTELVTKIPSNASRMSRPKTTPVFDCIVEVLAVLSETCTTHVASQEFVINYCYCSISCGRCFALALVTHPHPLRVQTQSVHSSIQMY